MSGPRSVLLTATSYPPAIGGAQVHAHELARAVTAAGGYRFRVVTQWSEQRTDWLLGSTLAAPAGGAPWDHDGIAVRRLRISSAARVAMLPWVAAYYLSLDRAIDRISDRMLIDLAADTAAIDLVQNVRIGREGLSYASWKLARRLDVPFVFVPLHHPRWVGWRYRPYIELYRRADLLLALTEHERQIYEGFGVEPNRICVTGMGPRIGDDPDGARFRERHGVGDAPLVLFLGQKYRYKGFAALLAATVEVWRAHPRARFAFLGPRTRPSIRAFRAATDPRVIELGAVDLATKTDALAACDLLCLPSSQESFGGVFTEAWMLGKPVIGGPAPAIREVVSDGHDGFVVAQDKGAIAGRILDLLRDPVRAAAMGAAGRRKVVERYTWEQIAARVTAAYDRLLR